MNTGQLILILGAFVMLSTLALSVNGMMINSTQLGLEMEAMMNALSIAQSMLDEILSKEFDEKSTGGKRLYSPTEATPESSFGPDAAGEYVPFIDTDFWSKTRFDDVDDYHLYRRHVYNDRFGWFEVTDTVRYVSETNPDVATGSRTFFKQVIVAVTNFNLPRQVESPHEIIPVVLRDLSIYRRYF